MNTSQKHHTFKLPKIGMRIIKTTIAVGICFFICFLLGAEDGPLFSTITAILCLQPQMGDSLKASINRLFGTILGAIFGLMVVYYFQYADMPAILTPREIDFLKYIVLTFCIIPIFYMSIVLNRSDAGGIAAIIFLSITSSVHDNSPFTHGFVRAGYTLLGVVVSLAVNRIHLPRRREKEYLFITKFDKVLYRTGEGITPYCKFELKQLLKKDIPLTIVTTRSPPFLMEHLENVPFKLPLITMDGAVLYDMNQKKYVMCHKIESSLADQIEDVLEHLGVHYFLHLIWQDVMFIYYKDFQNPVEQQVYESTRHSPHRNYVYGKRSDQGEVVAYVLILPEIISQIVEMRVGSMDTENQLYFVRDTMELPDGYCYLKIYDKSANKEMMMEYILTNIPQTKTIVFGGKENDLELIKNADYSYAIESSPQTILEVADVVIKGDEDVMGDKVVNTIFHLYMPLKWKRLPDKLTGVEKR